MRENTIDWTIFLRNSYNLVSPSKPHPDTRSEYHNQLQQIRRYSTDIIIFGETLHIFNQNFNKIVNIQFSELRFNHWWNKNIKEEGLLINLFDDFELLG
jgi:hypothetical protein